MKKILVVDDQPENLHILKDRLQRSGYSCITANNGFEGIELMQRELPDLILLDVMMPGLSGFEVCQKIQEDPIINHIPVILLTALTGPEDIQEGFQAGAFDYIKKPFNKIELIARINSALKFSEARKAMLEMEKVNIFSATVVTTNHEIKQPLTRITLAVAALKRQLNRDDEKTVSLREKVEIIEDSSKKIKEMLDILSSIKKPVIKEYLDNIKMIELSREEALKKEN